MVGHAEKVVNGWKNFLRGMVPVALAVGAVAFLLWLVMTW